MKKLSISFKSNLTLIIGSLLALVALLFIPAVFLQEETESVRGEEINLAKLEESKIGDKEIDKEIDKIIRHIRNSLEDKLWLDDWHLKPDLMNVKVFYSQRRAVKRMLIDLGECKEKPKIELPPEVKQVFKEIINNLVQADKLLARTIIEDAKVTDIKDPKFEKIVSYLIFKAEKEYEKGLEELERPICEKRLFWGYPQERAITRFLKSWLFAQLAIKMAGKELKIQGSLTGKAYIDNNSFIRYINGLKNLSSIKIFKGITAGMAVAIGAMFLLIYSLILWIVFKLVALIKKKKLELINKKVLFISVILGIVGGFLSFWMIFGIILNYLVKIQAQLSPDHFFYRLIPLIQQLTPAFFLSILVLFFSFILLKQFPMMWRNINIRLFYLILILIIWANIPVLTVVVGDIFAISETKWLESIWSGSISSLLSNLTSAFLLGFFFWGLMGLMTGLKYSIFFAIPVAFIVTEGMKSRGWRIGLMIVLIFLMCFACGPILALIAYPG